MSTRGSQTRRGRPAAAATRLELRRPLFVEPPPRQPERMLAALRTIFREHVEERLAFSQLSSVDPSSMDVERAR